MMPVSLAHITCPHHLNPSIIWKLVHVALQGYGTSAQGTKGGAWYLPAKSNLLFDIEIVGKAGKSPEKDL